MSKRQAGRGPGGFEREFVLALSEALLVPYLDTAEGGVTATGFAPRASAFLIVQRRGLPHAMPMMMALASWLMDLSTVPGHRRRFHRLDLARRAAVAAQWRNASLGPVRSFVKFHEVFASYIRYTDLREGAAP